VTKGSIWFAKARMQSARESPRLTARLKWGIFGTHRGNCASPRTSDDESAQKPEYFDAGQLGGDGSPLAPKVREHRHVPRSSRFDRADTRVRTERLALVQRLVSPTGESD